jgi:hypothetical protein
MAGGCFVPNIPTIMLPLWMLLALVSVTVAIPLLYIAITWDHDVVCVYAT